MPLPNVKTKTAIEIKMVVIKRPSVESLRNNPPTFEACLTWTGLSGKCVDRRLLEHNNASDKTSNRRRDRFRRGDIDGFECEAPAGSIRDIVQRGPVSDMKDSEILTIRDRWAAPDQPIVSIAERSPPSASPLIRFKLRKLCNPA